MTSISTKPLRADARRNRERVLLAAQECFARDGLEAQMDEIAAQAGVGVGTVYRHFATKEALIAGLATEYFAGQNAIVTEALAIEDAGEAFRGFLRQGAALMANSRALPQVMSDRPEVMHAAALAADAELGFFRSVEELIARAKRGGALREDFELEDVPAIMCGLGSMQISKGEYANWARVLEMIIDGLTPPARVPLPPIREHLPRL